MRATNAQSIHAGRQRKPINHNPIRASSQKPRELTLLPAVPTRRSIVACCNLHPNSRHRACTRSPEHTNHRVKAASTRVDEERTRSHSVERKPMRWRTQPYGLVGTRCVPDRHLATGDGSDERWSSRTRHCEIVRTACVSNSLHHNPFLCVVNVETHARQH